jgi:hypothetical protein
MTVSGKYRLHGSNLSMEMLMGNQADVAIEDPLHTHTCRYINPQRETGDQGNTHSQGGIAEGTFHID